MPYEEEEKTIATLTPELFEEWATELAKRYGVDTKLAGTQRNKFEALSLADQAKQMNEYLKELGYKAGKQAGLSAAEITNVERPLTYRVLYQALTPALQEMLPGLATGFPSTTEEEIAQPLLASLTLDQWMPISTTITAEMDMAKELEETMKLLGTEKEMMAEAAKVGEEGEKPKAAQPAQQPAFSLEARMGEETAPKSADVQTKQLDEVEQMIKDERGDEARDILSEIMANPATPAIYTRAANLDMEITRKKPLK